MSNDKKKILEAVGYKEKIKGAERALRSASMVEEPKENQKTVSGNCVKIDWKTTKIINKTKQIQSEKKDYGK